MTQSLIYPSPTIVLGVGRFGLAVLERLAEDWQRLRLSSPDPSIRNLRLTHVHPAIDDASPAWRDGERHLVTLARYVGEGDLPSLAVDFVILRSLGLVRYREGSYQVAVPRDAGLVERARQGALVRRRYFDWLTLHPDPIVAAERLEVLAERDPALGLFARPMVNRVKQGHSPKVLLRLIARCRALSEGRDPSPWMWWHDALRTARSDQERDRVRVRFEPSWVHDDDLSGLLEGFASEPIAGWTPWFKAAHHDWVGGDVSRARASLPSHTFDPLLPRRFLPAAQDLPSPLRPSSLLRVDWQTNGWATEAGDAGGEHVEFIPVDASPYRLGLFDHDASSRVHHGEQERFGERLEELGRLCHKGMVRLWVDLQRNRVEDQSFSLVDTRRYAGVDETLRQSLEVVGELVVRPLLSQRATQAQSASAPRFPSARQLDEVQEEPLPSDPSELLLGLELERKGEDNAARDALTRRLIALGFSSQEADVRALPLLRQVALGPSAARGDADGGMLELRQSLNEQVRRLLDMDFLSRYRHAPTRRPPRLTIYLVADMGEPFARATCRALLREVHAELLRAYGPVFETFREGFDRSLSVIPVLWMPHPADAFGGMHPVENRCEEAAIIEAVQGLRRWVETIPRGTRCVPQVIINSRVTDNAVLSAREAVHQTRDFITFQTRNDLSKDPWLRQTVVGPSGDDFFASFSCHEIDFPAERAREYLANRLAREAIRQIRRGEAVAAPQLDEQALAAPQVGALVRPATARTRQMTRQAAESTGQLVEERVAVVPHARADSLMGAFDEAFERELLRQIHDQWRALTRARGEMDGMMDALRRETSASLSKTLGVVQKLGDGLIEEHARRGGLKAAQAGFNQMEGISREALMGADSERQRSEALCRTHRIPQTAPVGASREAVVEAAAQKPELHPMRFGLLLWGVMAPALGAPLFVSLASALGLWQRPNPIEVALGPGAPVLGAIVAFLPVWWLLRRHMAQALEVIKAAIHGLAETARAVVEGSGGTALGASPSIRSFIEARLHLTAALNARNYAQRVHGRVVQDVELGHRLGRSVDVQEDVLMRRAEDLGVRAPMRAGVDATPAEDDLARLFSTRDGRHLDVLVDPMQLKAFYERRYGDAREIQAFVPPFVEAVGGFGQWRKQACMADTAQILAYTRAQFEELTARPVAELYTFEREVGDSLMRFVAAHYANMGFGAKFVGYEGLDPDGVRVLCDTALVLHPALRHIFDQARRRPDVPPFTETLQVIEADILPNAAYMMSFAQGIRPHSLRNLMRFESYHDRAAMPEDRAFPMSGEGAQARGPINHVTGFEPMRDALSAPRLAPETPPRALSARGGVSGESRTGAPEGADVSAALAVSSAAGAAGAPSGPVSALVPLTLLVPEPELDTLRARLRLEGNDG